MYCTASFFLIVRLLCSHILGSPSPEGTGFVFEQERRRSGEFSMDYFTMFALSASYCVVTSLLARASSVSKCCTATSWMTWPSDHSTFSQLTFKLRLIISFESAVLHLQQTQSPGYRGAQTDISSGCKAFASAVVTIVLFIFVLRDARACDVAFFHPRSF